MESWFYHCFSLETIIFPKNMNCKDLTNLNRTFQKTSLKNLDLSNWQFDTTMPVLMENTFAFCDNLEKIILPNVIFDNIRSLALCCFKLKSVTFAGGEFTEMCINKSVDSFGDCKNIELIDMSKIQTFYQEGHKQFVFKQFFTDDLTMTLDGANKDVIIILPEN